MLKGIWRTNYIQFGFITKIKIQDPVISRIISLIHLLDNFQVSMVFHGFNRLFWLVQMVNNTIETHLNDQPVREGRENWY